MHSLVVVIGRIVQVFDEYLEAAASVEQKAVVAGAERNKFVVCLFRGEEALIAVIVQQ